jgi:hypothetical protein
MSNARLSILQAVAVKDKRVSDSQFRTLAALGMYGDEYGWCFPSLETLGKDLGKSKQAVGRDTIALRKLGYLDVYHRHDKETGGRRSNLYRLKFDLPILPDVDGVSTSKVDGASTSEVDINVPSNAPSNALSNSRISMPIEWIIAHGQEVSQDDQDKTILEKQATDTFEQVFKFGTLPWSSNSTWTKFQKFVVKIYAADPDVFKDYVAWRKDAGKYTAFSNKKIRENPAAFMDTGYPEYEASKMYRQNTPAINDSAVSATKQIVNDKFSGEFTPRPEHVPPPSLIKQRLAEAAQQRGTRK